MKKFKIIILSAPGVDYVILNQEGCDQGGCIDDWVETNLMNN